jgi:anaphase-promoting complex subunit 4
MDELDHFRAFSTWLRFQIDRLALSNSEGEELTEKEAAMDLGKILTYIESYLVDSPLQIYFEEMAEKDRDQVWSYAEQGISLKDAVSAQIRKLEYGEEAMKAMPQVHFLVDYATHWSNIIFGNIAEAKKRSVRFGNPIRISIGRKMDMYAAKMHASGAVSRSCYFLLLPDLTFQGCVIQVALASKDESNRGASTIRKTGQ